MQKMLKTIATVLSVCVLSLAGQAFAGEFSVNPIRLELGSAAKSGVIVIKNDDQRALSFQMQAMQWTQDAQGKDVYADTSGLIFYPKILSIEPGQEGLIRIGVKGGSEPAEKTYRLFIEELPGQPALREGNGPQINVMIRFGAPIFVTPAVVRDTLDIDDFSLSKGVISFGAKNTGNRHQVVQGIELKGIDAAGAAVYAMTLADRYLLNGTAKRYEAKPTAAQCAKLQSLSLEFVTDKRTEKRQLQVDPALCR